MSRFSVTPVVLQPAATDKPAAAEPVIVQPIQPEMLVEPVPPVMEQQLQQQAPFVAETAPEQICVQASNEVLQQQMEQLYQQKMFEQQEAEIQQRELQLAIQQQSQPHIDLALWQQLQQQAAAQFNSAAAEMINASEYELQQQYYQQQAQAQYQQAVQQAQAAQQPSISTQVSVDHTSRDSLSSRMPETLEQLKIGLENITHVHVVTSKASTASLSSTQSSHSVQQSSDLPNEYLVQQQQQQQQFYQAQEYIPDVQPELAQEYVLDGNMAHLQLQQQQQQQLQLQQQHLLPSSQEVSLYNSRRTSADMNVVQPAAPLAVEQQVPQMPTAQTVQQPVQQPQTQPGSMPNSVTAVSAAGSDASTPNLRDQEKRLSNQGSVDRIDSSGNNSLADLHQKLAQLTSAQVNEPAGQQQQPQQPQQPKPPQLIAFEQQQLQTQQNSAVTSPSVEHPEPKFPNEAKPMIRKVSRFQVQAVQESPKTADQSQVVQPSQQQHNIIQQPSTNYSSPTDEKPCQTFPGQQQQPIANELVLPRTPNVESVQPNFAAAMQQQQQQQQQQMQQQIQQHFQQQQQMMAAAAVAAAAAAAQQQVQPTIMPTVPIQQQPQMIPIQQPQQPQQQQQYQPQPMQMQQAPPPQQMVPASLAIVNSMPQQQQQQQQMVPVQNANNTVAVYAEQNALETFNSEDIGQNLIAIQNHLRGMQLMSSSRQQLQLLLQRQHIEHEELKLRHFLELEKFLKQQKEEMKPPAVAAAAAVPPPAVQAAPPPQQQQQVPVSMQAPVVVPAVLADITSPTLTVSRGFDQGTITTPSYSNYNNGSTVSSGPGPGPELLDPDPTLTIVNETNK